MISKDKIKEIIREEMIREFKGLPGQSKVFTRVKNKVEALKQLKRQGVKYTEEDKEVHGFTWYNKKTPVAELDKNTLIVYEGRHRQQERLNEALDKKDYAEIKDIIRAEIAAVFFDLFRKRGVWV